LAHNLSLYDILVDECDSSSSDFANLSEEQKLRESIVLNLKKVLSTRQGSVKHLPDFGMPDVLQLYFDEGNTMEPLKKILKKVILKYEPRISNIHIENSIFDQDSMRIALTLRAVIKKSNNKLLTEFSSTGWTKVLFE
jgi:type VI secretion system protein